jgi:hypothetical protein
LVKVEGDRAFAPVDDRGAPRFLRTTKAVPRWILEAMEMRERNVMIMLPCPVFNVNNVVAYLFYGMQKFWVAAET